MCGIAGLFSAVPEAPVSEALLWTMVSVMQSRGPDGQSVWVKSGIGLAHARLRILDLDSRSDQPWVDAETGRVITFNGEIYNYLELREELQALGYHFRTMGDTEVILKAYDHWGTDCLNRFNGMWAFGIYDPATRSLFCARDRFGVKPFVYVALPEGLVFASEAKAILAAFPALRCPNLPFLYHFLQWADFAGSDETFYEGLHNLLPGHYFLVQAGEAPRPIRYWDWQPQVRPGKFSEDGVLSEFQALLEDAVRLRFRSDVPVGACLSGGMDSSSVVGIATQLFQTPISTFSCIYPDLPHVDESAYMRQITEKFHCRAHFVTPRFPHFLEAMRQSVWEQDGPTGGPSVLSQRAVMSLARGKVTVLLDGQGGDEVLGGYHSYFPFSLQGQLRDLFISPTPAKLYRYIRARQAIEARTGGEHLPKWHRLRKNIRIPVGFARPRFGHSVLDAMMPVENDDLSTKMLEELCWTLPNLLHYEDRNSMAFSLESRLPFLDYRLVEFLFSLPPTFKIRGSRTKLLLSETVQDLLPEAVVNRKDKMGFSTPGQHWFRANPETIEQLGDLLKKPPAVLLPLPEKFQWRLAEAWQQCLQGTPISNRAECDLWRYFTACLWLDALESPMPPSATGPFKVASPV